MVTILAIDLESDIATILASRNPESDLINVFEVLNLHHEKFQYAFDVALEMENRNLVKLLYSNVNVNKVIVEFTRLGKQANAQ
jgi:hypothetical protein